MPAWARRAGMLVIAMTVVVMHHIVGAHQHSAADATPMPGVAGAFATDTAAWTSGGPSGSGAHHVTGVAALHVHPGAQDDHDGGGGAPLLHLCLAVLSAVLLLAALCLSTEVWGRLAGPRERDGTALGSAARPPPLRVRLAHLQVLRL